jgi:hypothetical protein
VQTFDGTIRTVPKERLTHARISPLPLDCAWTNVAPPSTPATASAVSTTAAIGDFHTLNDLTLTLLLLTNARRVYPTRFVLVAGSGRPHCTILASSRMGGAS